LLLVLLSVGLIARAQTLRSDGVAASLKPTGYHVTSPRGIMSKEDFWEAISWNSCRNRCEEFNHVTAVSIKFEGLDEEDSFESDFFEQQEIFIEGSIEMKPDFIAVP
jgi:hypothetical protein